jgi:hypothetical protein
MAAITREGNKYVAATSRGCCTSIWSRQYLEKSASRDHSNVGKSRLQCLVDNAMTREDDNSRGLGSDCDESMFMHSAAEDCCVDSNSPKQFGNFQLRLLAIE